MKHMYQLKQIPSEAQVKKYLRRTIFGKNLSCPSCKSRLVAVYETRYRCRNCRLKFSLLSHTWLSDMKLPYQKFWMVLWCWTIQIPVKQAQTLSGLSDEAVRRWYGNFRTHLPQETHILERIVQLDEAFFKNMTLMMAKQKGTRKLAWDVFPGTAPNRTHVRRMYHHHWSENLAEYVREFAFRFSSPELFENPLYYLKKSLSLAPID